MLKLHKDLPKAKTPHEQETIQRQIAATALRGVYWRVCDALAPT